MNGSAASSAAAGCVVGGVAVVVVVVLVVVVLVVVVLVVVGSDPEVDVGASASESVPGDVLPLQATIVTLADKARN